MQEDKREAKLLGVFEKKPLGFCQMAVFHWVLILRWWRNLELVVGFCWAGHLPSMTFKLSLSSIFEDPKCC